MDKIKTWEDVKTLDDTLTPREKSILGRLQDSDPFRCPHLKRTGLYFHSCNLKPSSQGNEREINPSNPIYQRKLEVVELELYCTDRERHKICIFYEKLEKKE